MQRTKNIVIGCVALLGSTGCAGGKLRSEAVELAKLTEHVATTGQRVQASRDALAKARTDNLHQLEDSALELESEVARRTAAWRVAGLEARVGLYEGVHGAVAAESERLRQRNAQRERHAAELAAAKSATQVRAKELRGVANKLMQLGKELTTKEYVEFYIGFASEVRDAIDEAECDAGVDPASGGSKCP